MKKLSKIIIIGLFILFACISIYPYGNHRELTGKSIDAKLKIYREGPNKDPEWAEDVLSEYRGDLIRGSEEDIHPLSKKINSMSEEEKEAYLEYLLSSLPLAERMLIKTLILGLGLDNALQNVLNAIQTISHFWSPYTRKGLSSNHALIKARDFYNQALIEYGNGNKSKAFELLGHAMHLLQDMGSPSPIHNAIHVWHSINEKYVERNWRDERWYSGGSIDSNDCAYKNILSKYRRGNEKIIYFSIFAFFFDGIM